MKLVTYSYHDQTYIGAAREDDLVPLTAVALDMQTLIEMGAAGLAQAGALLAAAAEPIPLSAVKLLAPIPTPRRNIMCLGWNYAEHAAESAATKGLQIKELPQVPIVFTKATTAVTGPYDDIQVDAAISTEMDWEVELAVVIGRRGRDIAREQALDYVFGYTILNDISARDLQRAGKQFFKGKSLDNSGPMGPWLVTADSLASLQNLRVCSRVNGVIKQDSHTRHMIFDVPATIEYLSRGMTLLPGDIIATGTPGGVGFARQPPQFLGPGDVVECEVDQIGTLRNRIVAA